MLHFVEGKIPFGVFKMNEICIIFNPSAGRNKLFSEKRVKKLEKIVGEHGFLRITNTKEELCAVAKECYEKKIKVLAISGGDGTTNCVLSQFTKIYQDQPLPFIALLKGGTMNLLEASLKMRGTPESRLKKLIRFIQKGIDVPIVNHTLLKVNDKMGFIFGNGAVANFMHVYYKGGDAGFIKALKLCIKACWESIYGSKFLQDLFAPIKATVQVGERNLPETSFVALLAATEKECGLGFKPFYRAREEQGKMHFLAVNVNPWELMWDLPRIRVGKKMTSPSVYDIVTDKVTIQTDDHYYYTVDGEMLNSSKKIELSGGPVVQLLAI
jgi:diacylglycerol kinase family enzyme